MFNRFYHSLDTFTRKINLHNSMLLEPMIYARDVGSNVVFNKSASAKCFST